MIDKELVLKILNEIDVKKLYIDHENQEIVKWFRFGSHNGLQIAKEIINSIEEEKVS